MDIKFQEFCNNLTFALQIKKAYFNNAYPIILLAPSLWKDGNLLKIYFIQFYQVLISGSMAQRLLKKEGLSVIFSLSSKAVAYQDIFHGNLRYFSCGCAFFFFPLGLSCVRIGSHGLVHGLSSVELGVPFVRE